MWCCQSGAMRRLKLEILTLRVCHLSHEHQMKILSLYDVRRKFQTKNFHDKLQNGCVTSSAFNLIFRSQFFHSIWIEMKYFEILRGKSNPFQSLYYRRRRRCSHKTWSNFSLFQQKKNFSIQLEKKILRRENSNFPTSLSRWKNSFLLFFAVGGRVSQFPACCWFFRKVLRKFTQKYNFYCVSEFSTKSQLRMLMWSC